MHAAIRQKPAKGVSYMYPWIVFLHALGGYGFVLAHGVSFYVALALRRERNMERMRALLDLSLASNGLMGISLLVLLAAGVAAGFMGGWWGSGWIWTSLVILIGVSALMGILGASFYGRLRALIGATPPRNVQLPAPERPPTPEELDQVMAREPSALLTAVGLLGLVVIIFLMRFKPF
jgi:hypothetical protein